MSAPTADELIRRALPEVVALLAEAFEAVGNEPEPGSALDQAGLVDGAQIVEDYIEYNEVGIALDHLIYMIDEPGLRISNQTYAAISEAGLRLGVDARLWERIKPVD